jgi:hypothetical protein
MLKRLLRAILRRLLLLLRLRLVINLRSIIRMIILCRQRNGSWWLMQLLLLVMMRGGRMLLLMPLWPRVAVRRNLRRLRTNVGSRILLYIAAAYWSGAIVTTRMMIIWR